MPPQIWNVSVRAETPVGPWAFSLHLCATDRASAEATAMGYLQALCPGSALRVARVLRLRDAHWPERPGLILGAKASDGDAVRS